MSVNLNNNNDSNEDFDGLDMYIGYKLYEDSKNATHNSKSYSTSTYSDWREIENNKRRKIRYYYENYSFKKLITDFFGIIITSGLIIIFFIYRHIKHKEYRDRVKKGEFKEEDFLNDLYFTDTIEKAKFYDKDI